MKISQALRRSLSAVAILVLTLPLMAADKVWIIQTNSAGDSIHIIDAATNKVLAEVGRHGAKSWRTGLSRRQLDLRQQ